MVASEAPTGPPIHLIGTPAFFPSLLSYVHDTASSPSALPLDPVIFQSILLCLVAGDKHLILRTPEEDVGLVLKLASWTLSSVFDFPTHKFKIRSRSKVQNDYSSFANPASFLRSLFLPSLKLTDETDDNVSASSHSHLPHVQSRTRSLKPRSRGSQYKRSISFPNDLAGASRSQESKSLLDHATDYFADASHKPRRGSGYSRELHHAHTAPNPIRPDPNTIRRLPHGLVVSGLEYARPSYQRSLIQVLSEKRVVINTQAEERKERVGQGQTSALELVSEDESEDGVWNLPENFIMVYVCPVNPRERPAIHKSLLDRFAMSSNIFVSQNVRYALQSLPFSPSTPTSNPFLYSQSNPSTPSPAHALPLPQTPPYISKALPQTHQRHLQQPLLPNVIPKSFIENLRDICRHTYMSPNLSLYLGDLFSAARHHPQLDGTLLTMQATKDAETLVRADRVIGADLTGSELIRPPTIAGGMEESASRHVMFDSKCAPDSHPPTSSLVLDVSEVDVARIVPRVISHRLRVRDGPREEVLASAIFGATFDDSVAGDGETSVEESIGDTRTTVKSVLVHLMAEV